jgi:hypothetical protein
VTPWIVLALVAVPLLLVGFLAARRRVVATDPATEQEFSEAEAYEAAWREEDKERFHREHLP